MVDNNDVDDYSLLHGGAWGDGQNAAPRGSEKAATLYY